MTTQDDSSQQQKTQDAKILDPRWEPPEDWRTKLVFERLDRAFDLISPFRGVEHDSAVLDALLVSMYQVALELDIIRRELAWARHARQEASA